MNENFFTHNGRKFRANTDGYTGCSQCALFNDNCAKISRPACNSSKRTDGQNVNFQRVGK